MSVKYIAFKGGFKKESFWNKTPNIWDYLHITINKEIPLCLFLRFQKTKTKKKKIIQTFTLHRSYIIAVGVEDHLLFSLFNFLFFFITENQNLAQQSVIQKERNYGVQFAIYSREFSVTFYSIKGEFKIIINFLPNWLIFKTIKIKNGK